MTRRKRTKAPKPILCPACATELTPAFIRSSANSLAGSADRPGAVGLVRNPTGKAKACKHEYETMCVTEVNGAGVQREYWLECNKCHKIIEPY